MARLATLHARTRTKLGQTALVAAGSLVDAESQAVVNPDAYTTGGAVAQLGERLTGSQEVDGSIPFSSTILRSRDPRMWQDVWQVARGFSPRFAPACRRRRAGRAR